MTTMYTLRLCKDNYLSIVYTLSRMSGDKCVPLSEVRKELESLVAMARESGDSEMERLFNGQLAELSQAGGRRKSRRHHRGRRGRTHRRSRYGGVNGESKSSSHTKVCHAITTAMMMSGGAAITYLSYLAIFPVVAKSLPQLCGEGVKDQVLSAVLGVWDKSLTCTARQAKWDVLRANVIKYVLGVEAAAVLTDKAVMGKSKLKEYYNKLLEWNVANVCPVIESAAGKTKRGVCSTVTAPFRAAMAVGRGALSGLSALGRGSRVAMMRDDHSFGHKRRAERKGVDIGTGMDAVGRNDRATSVSKSPKSATKESAGIQTEDVVELKRPRRDTSQQTSSPTRRRSRSRSPGKPSSSSGGRRTRRIHRRR